MRKFSLLASLGLVGCTVGTPATYTSPGAPEAETVAPSEEATPTSPSIVGSKATGVREPNTSASVRWARAYGAGELDLARSIARTASGVVVAGMVGPGANIGCGTRSGSSYAAFVASYTSSGDCSWATYFEGDDFVSASGIGIDAQGSILVAGTFYGSLTMGGTVYPSAGGADGFAAKLTANGSVQWARRFGGTSEEYVYSAALNGARFAIGGAFYDTTSFGSWQKTSNGDADAFLAELTDQGEPASLRAFGGSGWDSVDALAAGPAGKLVAGGTFADEVDFGGGAIVSRGGQDGYLATFETTIDGPVSYRSIGGTASDAVHAIAVDANGQIHVAGYFHGSADFGGQAAVTGTGTYSGFLASYDATLGFARTITFDGAGRVIPSSIAIDGAGMIAVGGYFSGTTSLGTAKGESDGFITTLTETGSIKWTKQFGASGSTQTHAVAFAPNGDVVGAGAFDGTIPLLAGEGAAAGEMDGLVFALAR